MPDCWETIDTVPGGYRVQRHRETGHRRTIKESRCRCGKAFLIDLAGNPGRRDGKRVFPMDEPDTGWDSFRCRKCQAPVSESVPGAEYEKG